MRILLSLAVALAPAAATSASRASPGGPGVVIQDVTLISPERAAPLRHADVVLRDGRIARIGVRLPVGPELRRVDGRGRFLIPGLIDSHVHAGNPVALDDDAIEAHPDLLAAYRAQVPRSYLAFGFTTVVDLNLAKDTRAWFEAAPLHPNFYSCGHGVTIPGGYLAQRPAKDAAAARAANLVYEPGQPENWPKTVDPADFTPERAVARAADGAGPGAVCVKTFIEPGFGGAYHWPVPRPETLAALRAEAHRRGLVLIVHANGVDSWRKALDAKADIIAHGIWQWPGDLSTTAPPPAAEAVIAAAARAGTGVQPTLQSVYGDLSIFDPSILDDPRFAEAMPPTVVAYQHSPAALAARRATEAEYRQAFASLYPGDRRDAAALLAIPPARASATLRLMASRNVRLLFGSDTPANEGVGNPPGLNGRLELQRWSDAGVPPGRILRSATLDNAKAFHLAGKLGSIEVGKQADLLLLGADPLKSVAAYDRIETVFLHGAPIPRPSLMPVR